MIHKTLLYVTICFATTWSKVLPLKRKCSSEGVRPPEHFLSVGCDADPNGPTGVLPLCLLFFSLLQSLFTNGTNSLAKVSAPSRRALGRPPATILHCTQASSPAFLPLHRASVLRRARPAAFVLPASSVPPCRR
jgi:hypothetical protein